MPLDTTGLSITSSWATSPGATLSYLTRSYLELPRLELPWATSLGATLSYLVRSYLKLPYSELPRSYLARISNHKSLCQISLNKRMPYSSVKWLATEVVMSTRLGIRHTIQWCLCLCLFKPCLAFVSIWLPFYPITFSTLETLSCRFT